MEEKSLMENDLRIKVLDCTIDSMSIMITMFEYKDVHMFMCHQYALVYRFSDGFAPTKFNHTPEPSREVYAVLR